MFLSCSTELEYSISFERLADHLLHLLRILQPPQGGEVLVVARKALIGDAKPQHSLNPIDVSTKYFHRPLVCDVRDATCNYRDVEPLLPYRPYISDGHYL